MVKTLHKAVEMYPRYDGRWAIVTSSFFLASGQNQPAPAGYGAGLAYSTDPYAIGVEAHCRTAFK